MEKVSTQYPRVRWNKGIRKVSACVFEENAQKTSLPEGQVTSFFKSAMECSETADTNQSGHENDALRNSDNNFTVSDLDEAITNQIGCSLSYNENGMYGN